MVPVVREHLELGEALGETEGQRSPKRQKPKDRDSPAREPEGGGRIAPRLEGAGRTNWEPTVKQESNLKFVFKRRKTLNEEGKRDILSLCVRNTCVVFEDPN